MNLVTIIDGHPDDAPALVSRGRVTTYGDLRQQTAELRGGLHRLGVRPGDRVAIVSANNWFFVTAYLAVLGVGAVAVPLNPASPSAEVQAELAAVRATVAIVGPSGRDAMRGVDRAAAGLQHVLVTEGLELDGSERVEALFGGDEEPVVERAPDDLAVLIFTAGTGGSPKAAMLTHGNLLSNLEQMQRHPGQRISEADVALGVLPMFHIFGLNVILGLTLHAGASVVLVERYDPASSLETIRNHGVTLIAGAPPMFSAWAGMIGVGPDDMPAVRIAISGAAPLAEEIAEAFEARFGIPLHQGYGLTEAGPVVTSPDVSSGRRPGSVGSPLPGVEVRLVDVEGEDALGGDEGEIWVRGPNVFAGYWENTEATANALDGDGWLHTGDVGVVDDDGFLYIVDRQKDLIIVSGFNVYPQEVEEALLEHPAIAGVAVVGVAHPHTGEAVKAFVVEAEGNHLEEDQVIEFCADRLARYKCPTKVMFVPELPHGLGGKLLRRELKAG